MGAVFLPPLSVMGNGIWLNVGGAKLLWPQRFRLEIEAWVECRLFLGPLPLPVLPGMRLAGGGKNSTKNKNQTPWMTREHQSGSQSPLTLISHCVDGTWITPEGFALLGRSVEVRRRRVLVRATLFGRYSSAGHAQRSPAVTR